MLTALQESFKFLFDSLMIVIIFTLFFAACGLHLLYGLFTYRCYDEATGIYFEVKKIGLILGLGKLWI
jgi:hypothetical protein